MASSSQTPNRGVAQNPYTVVRTPSKEGQTGAYGSSTVSGGYDPQEQTQNEKSRLDVPASQQNASSSTGLSGSTASDPAESVGRGSKRSRRRDGSAASSRHSQTAPAAGNDKAAQPVSSAPGQASQPRAKRKSKFFSFLCCSAPDESNDTEQEESAQVVKQPVRAAPSRVTQPPPPGQQTGNPEKVISHEVQNTPFDEKDKSPPYVPEQTQSIIGGQGEIGPQRAVQSDQPLPDLPTDPTMSGTLNHAYGDEKTSEMSALETQRNPPPTVEVPDDTYQASNPQVMIQAPTPVVQQEEDAMIRDRTPEQQARDTDIEMTDVGPSLPLSSNEVSGTSEDDTIPAPHRESTSHVDLPPPPPLEERQAQMNPVAAVPSSQDTSLVPSPAESQKWLLPPLRPEFRGRKCLVLDLDETLVHSSFKVSTSYDKCSAGKLTDMLKILHQADFTIPVEIEGQYHNVYVIKRPGVDAFMKRVGELYEVVVFTASVSKVSRLCFLDARPHD